MLLNTLPKKYTAFLQFCFPSMTFWLPLQFLILCGTVFEVLTVAVIHYAFWVRTTYGVVHSYECSGGPFWLSSQATGRYRQYAFTKTSVSTNVITLPYNLNLNILLFPCIISPFITNQRFIFVLMTCFHNYYHSIMTQKTSPFLTYKRHMYCNW